MIRPLLIGFLCWSLTLPVWAGASRNFVPGDGDDVTFATGFTLSDGDAYSICAHFLTDDTGAGNRTMGGFGIETGAQFLNIFRIQGSTLFVYHFRTGSNFRNVNGGTITTATWFHGCGTCDGTTGGLKLFLDGTELGTPEDCERVKNDGSDGAWGDQVEVQTSENWDGRIAYGQIYNRDLSLTEIQELRFNPSVIVSGFQVYHPLWGSDSPEIDLSGNGRTGTLAGTDEDFDGPPVFLAGGLPL